AKCFCMRYPAILGSVFLGKEEKILPEKNPSMDFLNDCRSKMLLHALTRLPWLGIPLARKKKSCQRKIPS
ncbi:MAG TPA: hypothetical protein DCZ76_13495, partial [Treponema sp.]|nr:hypothetical protein [Treponema sp.]